jgi:mitogen-activated protein kinase kinase 1
MSSFQVPPLDISLETSNNVRFTNSGAYCVGNFFKINEDGFEFKNEVKDDSGDPSFQRLEISNPADLQSLRSVGKGSSGVVQRARHIPTGKIVALKVVPIDLSEKKSKQVITELRTLHNSSSPHIVSFHGAFYKERAISLILEFMDGGSLLDILRLVKTIEEKYLAKIAEQVLKGFVYLHEKRRIIHRDIKPSNILFNRQGEVKIADFGVSGSVEDSNSKVFKMTFAGTVTYMSPERIQAKSHSFDSDLWSLGLTLMECAMGRFPYLTPVKEGERKPALGFWEMFDHILKSPIPQLPSECSEEFRTFVGKCLQKSPKKRAKAAELLNHPFITKWTTLDLSSWIASILPLDSQAGISCPIPLGEREQETPLVMTPLPMSPPTRTDASISPSTQNSGTQHGLLQGFPQGFPQSLGLQSRGSEEIKLSSLPLTTKSEEPEELGGPLSLGGLDAIKADMSGQVPHGALPLDIPLDIQPQDESTSISSEGQFGFQLHLDISDSDSENAMSSPIVVTPLPPHTTPLSLLSLSPLSVQSISTSGLSQLPPKVFESLEAQLRTPFFVPKSQSIPQQQTHDEKNILKSDLGFDVRGQELTETPVESLPGESVVKVKESGVWTTSPTAGPVESSPVEPLARSAAGRPRANRKRRRSTDSSSG